MTDQQSSWTLGCYGGTAAATPHIDGLAREGALLGNYFANVACCTPSRGVVAELTERLIEHNRAIDAPEAAWLERVG